MPERKKNLFEPLMVMMVKLLYETIFEGPLFTNIFVLLQVVALSVKCFFFCQFWTPFGDIYIQNIDI